MSLPRSRALLRDCCLGLGLSLSVLPAEALHAAGRVDQLLLAREERVASRADFHVNVALVGRARLKGRSAGAHDANLGVIGVNLFLWHLSQNPFPAIHQF